MQRKTGLCLLVFGLAILAGVAWRLPPELVWIGSLVTVAGALVLGLSFIPRPIADTGTPPLNFPARIAGMFYAPSVVFRSLRVHPYWGAGFLVMALCIVIYNVAFIQRMTPETIAEAKIDRVIKSGFVAPDQAEQVKEQEIQAAQSTLRKVSSLLFLGVYLLIYLSAVAALYLLGVAMVGGRMTLWQSLSLTIYAYLPPVIIRYLLSLAILYIKPIETIDPFSGQQGILYENLGLLLSPVQHPVLYTAATFVSILSLYKLWLAATGIRIVGEDISKGGAWAVALTVWAIGLGISLLGAVINPNFVS
ncbi:MAG TPA: YIP1 family protein [Pyrinomonadaceae bacterium]|jgi:hypothetical protein